MCELSKEENCTNEAHDNIIGDVDEEIKLKVRKTFQLITTKLSKKILNYARECDLKLLFIYM